MKAGWKSRIDERRYFEELRTKQAKQRMENAKQRAVVEAIKTAREVAYVRVGGDKT